MRNFGDTPDSQERYGDSFGNGAKPTDESPRGRKLLIDYSHGRRASEGEVQYTRKLENSFERDRGNSENLYGSFRRDRGNGNQQDASLEGHINYGKDLDDAVNRDIFTQKRKNPFEQESDCIKKLKELSQSDLVCQKKPFNLFGQGMEYKPISDGPVKRDRAYRKRKKIVERDNRYKKACDRSFKKRRNFVQEHKGNKIKNKAGHKISDESEKEVENKARLMSQRRLKLYLKELQQLKSIEKDLKGKHYVEEQTINENKALQEELQKEINKLRGHQSQINDALPDSFENGKKQVKSKDHSIEGMGNGQFKENFFLHGQFASQDGTNRFLSDSVMMKHGLAKNETPVMENEIMDDRKVLASPVIEHSDIMPCNDIELNKDIKQMLFDKLTLKPMQSRREFLKLQWQDPSLADIRREFELGNRALSRGGNKITKFIEKDTLIHKVILEGDKYSYQLVVPTSLREDVMQLAHTSSAEGHLSRRKTHLRIQKEFHWPDVNTDVRMFCRYCMICNSLLRNETKMGHSDTNSSEDGEESISNSEVDQEDKNVFLKNSLFSNCGLFSLEEFAEAQLNDPKFHPILWDVENGIERVRAGKKKGTVKFVKEQNLIFRQYTENDKVYHQLVVPHIYRKQLIKMAHESSGTQHLNKMQTRLKMLREFYWQELRIDVKLVCDSCGVCNMKLSDTIGVKDQMLYDPNDRKRKFQKEKFKEQEIKHDGPKTQDELAEKDPLVDLLFSKCSREDFKEALIKDADLNDIRHGAESGQDVTIFGLSHKFIKKEDLIYRQATIGVKPHIS